MKADDAPASSDTHGLDEAAGFVLAGGMSTRMGADKALVQLAGQPLIAHAIGALDEIGHTASIAGARAGAHTELERFAAVIPDELAGLGPLGGICAALTSTQARWSVFLSIDLPLLPASLPACLLRRAQVTDAAVTLCSVGGFTQTFPAVVGRSALPLLRAELDAGRSGCFAAFRMTATALGRPLAVVATETLAQCGQVHDPRGLPTALWFLNVNTPRDLARAESLTRRGVARGHRVS